MILARHLIVGKPDRFINGRSRYDDHAVVVGHNEIVWIHPHAAAIDSHVIANNLAAPSRIPDTFSWTPVESAPNCACE